MVAELQTIHRRKLYEEVWAEPVVKVAPRYGLSDSGLLKICDRLGVPTPALGYWARVRAGQNVQRKDLPSTSGPLVYHRRRLTKKCVTNLPSDVLAPVNQMLDDGFVRYAPISKPISLSECLPVTQQIAAHATSASRDGRGWPAYSAGTVATIETSGRYAARGLLLINALFETLGAAGHYVPAASGQSDLVPVQILDLRYSFRLREKSPAAGGTGQNVGLKEFGSEPTGEFELHAFIEGGRYRIAALSDARRTSVEERIWRFVLRLRHVAIDHRNLALSGE
ncbi:hypothetical protein OKW35_006453 [Paraburkholderia sp. MM5477-R1]